MQGIVDKFKDLIVLVVGDVMLDVYLFGHCKRSNPEAPHIPVWDLFDREQYLGGAANAASTMHLLGARVALCGVVGNDRKGADIYEEAEDFYCNFLAKEQGRETMTKTRVMLDGVMAARLDWGHSQSPNENTEKAICAAIQTFQCDGIFVSDYAKGLLTGPIRQELQRFSLKPICVDPKGPFYPKKYSYANHVTPNEEEYQGLSPYTSTGEFDSILIKRGKAGATVDGVTEYHDVPPHPVEVANPSGAGDVAAAVYFLSILAGGTYLQAAEIANIAAAIGIAKPGTSYCTLGELEEELKCLS